VLINSLAAQLDWALIFEDRGYTVEKKLVVCSMCDLSCTLEAHLENGSLIKLQGWAGHPVTPNVFCNKPANAAKWFYNDRRLLHPLKRKGDRGCGQWEQISWDQAMDEIARRLQEVVGRYGPESLACSTSEYNSQVGSGACRRFMNLLGSPNYISGVSLCMGNTAAVNSMTYGGYPFPDYENTRCVVYFGHNPKPNVWAGEYQRLKAAMARGAKLIVLDPRKSHCAKMADVHLQLRAGTDAAMALGWINVIITESLYDEKFVSRWCVGFDELKARVLQYPPEKVETITGVPARLIREGARLYARNTPGVIPWTCITDQQINSTSALRCQSILRALTGNLNVPGGDVIQGPNPLVVSESELELHEALPGDKKALQLGADKHPVMTYRGQQALAEPRQKVFGRSFINLMKGQYLAHPPAVFRAMREGVPYPVKAFFSVANNTLMCYTNQRGIHEALKSVDLFVVNDIFMSPTAQLADYVLPGDSFLERPVLYNCAEWINTYFVAPQAVEPPGECKDVYFFWRELAVRMDMEEHFPWKTLQDLYDYRVAAMGLSWQEIQKHFFAIPSVPPEAVPIARGFFKSLSRLNLLSVFNEMILGTMHRQQKARQRLSGLGMKRLARLFEDHISLKPYPHKKLGFATPSGKVELLSSVMEGLGLDPLPYWKDIGAPGETTISGDPYPLQLFVGLREEEYFHSAGRHVENLRKRNPEPLAILNDETARGMGIEEGAWIYVETTWGRIRMKATLSADMHPNLVRVPHGWYKPEKDQGEPSLSGAFEHSDGVLLDDDPALMDPEQGLPDLRGGRRCRVYPVEAT
jgi:anaerobic selenocysteine-containing dehydrogenase